MRTPTIAEAWLIQGAARLAAGRRAPALAVLTFHRVLPEPDPLLASEPHARQFAALLDLLQACFRVLPLREAVARLRGGSLPPRALCITFDDGYANNCDVALPLLDARGLPATVFVATGYLNGGAMFNDVVVEALRAAPARVDLAELGLGVLALSTMAERRAALGRLLERVKYTPHAQRAGLVGRLAELCGLARQPRLMMDDEQVRTLHRRGIEIGAHTVTHPILAGLDADEVRSELARSKQRLEQLTGAPVTSFAYPNGVPGRDYLGPQVGLVREAGFELAVSTSWGTAGRDADVYQLPRVAPYGGSPLAYGLRLAASYRDDDYLLA